jgi:hypothetical protein
MYVIKIIIWIGCMFLYPCAFFKYQLLSFSYIQTMT